MSDRKVFLGMPGYGKQTAAAGRGFWRACRDMTGVWNAYQQGSLLACNFNALWCAALNRINQGHRLDYFAMLHDDVGPEDFWLDKLIDELEANELDVLGVAVPIKDRRGLTSLCIDNPGDTWMPKCRVSMRDLYSLPETFTSKEFGKPLLLNTGCWVCKFDPAWVKKVHFEINDRIVFNRAQDRYQAQTEPEDWFFSRLLHELGLKVGATRKVAVMHQGEMDFTNSAPWGTDTFDQEHTDKSPIEGAFPYEIPGWLLPEEGRALAKLSEGKRVLEIGSYCGLSTVCIARTAKSVTAVDYFDGRGTPSPRNTLDDFNANLKRYGVREKVSTVHPHDDIGFREYDLAFIDGAHDYESVRLDIHKAMNALKPGGLLVFHDYNRPGDDTGVTNAVSDFISDGAELIETYETLAVVRPPAFIPLEV